MHIGAPGRDILSTTPNNTYSYDSGTSMATPHVTGVAALLKAQNPALDWRAIKNLILAGGDTVPSLQGTISQKRLNAYGALTCTTGTIGSRLMPIADIVSGTVGSPTTLSFLNIKCAQPAGSVPFGRPNVFATTISQQTTESILRNGRRASQEAIRSLFPMAVHPSSRC